MVAYKSWDALLESMSCMHLPAQSSSHHHHHHHNHNHYYNQHQQQQQLQPQQQQQQQQQQVQYMCMLGVKLNLAKPPKYNKIIANYIESVQARLDAKHQRHANNKSSYTNGYQLKADAAAAAAMANNNQKVVINGSANGGRVKHHEGGNECLGDNNNNHMSNARHSVTSPQSCDHCGCR